LPCATFATSRRIELEPTSTIATITPRMISIDPAG
jgi:hypothetical protein